MSDPHLWPSVLTKQIRDDRHRRAEVQVYDLLKKELDGSWTVFYSRPWLGLTPTGEEKDGECDFVVVHPDHGYLTIEVKGGGITYDPSTEKWISTDRDGIRHKIKNPVEQARSAKHELLKKLKIQKSWPSGRFIRMRHGVIFPDTESPPSNLGADRPRDLFCCRPDLPSLKKWILDRLSGGAEEALGREGLKAFIDLLALPFTLRVPLGHVLSDDDKSIASLTPQQYFILDAVSHLPRVAAGGGAGTGKTIVAMEDAVRMAQQGLKTALICLSENLASHLRERLKATDVSVWSFAGLCEHFAIKSKIMNAVSPKLAEEKGAELLIQAVKEDPSLRLDAIVVDEAQDFRSHWWIALTEILVDPKKSRLHAFYDTNQSVYGDLTGELAGFDLVPIRLTRNLRNTQIIHSTASRFYQGTPVTADGPEGVAVEWLNCTADNIGKMAADTAYRLINEDAVMPGNLAILSANDKVLSDLKKEFSHKLFAETVIDQIRDFKGLERQVIILAATREIADEPELAYVALSRPRVHLIVIGEPEVIKWLRGLP